MKTSIIPVLVALVSLPSLVLAQAPSATTGTWAASPTPVDDGGSESSEGESVLTHEGFMLRLSGGLALLGAGIEPSRGVEFGAGGVGQAFSLSIGGYVARNFALHGDVYAASSGYTVTETDEEGSVAHADHFTLGAVGMGITYFVMPYNWSVTGSLMLGDMSLRPENGVTYDTDYAVFGKFGVAKQWPVSDYWGLGIGANVMFGYGKGEDSNEEKFDGGMGGFGVDFVATYD